MGMVIVNYKEVYILSSKNKLLITSILTTICFLLILSYTIIGYNQGLLSYILLAVIGICTIIEWSVYSKTSL